MQSAYFITGTDTHIGKTWTTVALMNYFKSQGKTVAGMKPVASGCELINGRLVNTDALLMQQHASINLAYEAINPYAYELPISPHLAGRENPADFSELQIKFKQLKKQTDIVLVEGAGGWYSPLTARQSNGDLAKVLDLPVLLVVGIRVGCINHALLTAKAIADDSVMCAGWLANCLQPINNDDNAVIKLLKERITAPCLGVLPYMPEQDFSLIAKSIDFNGVIS